MHRAAITPYIRDQVAARTPPLPPDVCWPWAGSLNHDGYGRLHVRSSDGRREYRAHRLSYEIHVGPIPDDLELDHLCRNRRCVNPRHLEPVDHVTNLGRSENHFIRLNGAKTRCPQGHEYGEVDGRGWRICRPCKQEKDRRRRAERARAA